MCIRLNLIWTHVGWLQWFTSIPQNNHPQSQNKKRTQTTTVTQRCLHECLQSCFPHNSSIYMKNTTMLLQISSVSPALCHCSSNNYRLFKGNFCTVFPIITHNQGWCFILLSGIMITWKRGKYLQLAVSLPFPGTMFPFPLFSFSPSSLIFSASSFPFIHKHTPMNKQQNLYNFFTLPPGQRM